MEFSSLEKCLEQMDAADVPFYDCIVMKDHKQIFRKQSGFADPEKKTPVSDQNLYWIYSMSKVITNTAFMQLVERGKVNLDDRVSRYIPEFAHLTVQKGDRTVPAETPLTIRHLATMQGGLDYDLNRPEIAALNRRTGNQATTREIVGVLAQKPLSFEPGSCYQYSLCHDVLAAVLEEVAGMTFGEYLQKNIFDPLEMRDTGFRLSPEQQERLSVQYRRDEASNQIVRTGSGNVYCLSGRYESGGAGLFSNPTQYIKVPDALCCGGVGAAGARILKPETIDLMKIPQLSEASHRNFSLYGEGYSYGLGMRTLVDRSCGAKSPLGEFGWDGAAGSYVLIDAHNHLTAVLFKHVLSDGAYSHAAANRIRDAIYTDLNA